MNNFLRYGGAGASVFQLTVELFWLFIAGVAAIVFLERVSLNVPDEAAPEIVYAVLIVAFNIGFGVYHQRESLARSTYFTRVCVASAIATLLAYVIADVLPGGTAFRQSIGVAALFAISGLLLVRHMFVLPLINSLLPYRVLVIGTGLEARRVEASLAEADTGMQLVGFFPLENPEEVAVSSHRIVVASPESLPQTVKKLRINEIVVAVRQQRGGVLPLRELLACRLNGVKVSDLARFFERVQGHVPLEMSRASWFIYGEGYRQSWLRGVFKRTMDLAVVCVLILLALPVMLVAVLAIAAESPGPVIYRQERVGRRGRKFTLLKFRSMVVDAERDGKPAWARVKDARVTRVGRFLRQTRIDELPQLINVLRGEMSLVGPRPERPEFVSMLSEQIPFYSIRHSVKPGITGWAQVRYSYTATVDDAAKKLEYDIYYVKNHSSLLDILILLETVRVVLLGEGAR